MDTAKRQCKAHSKQTGARCKRAPIEGGTVCKFHGGGAPQVKLAAEERLKALADPAITRLEYLIDYGENDSVRLGAVKDALDRTGYKPTEKRQLDLNGRLTVDDLREALN